MTKAKVYAPIFNFYALLKEEEKKNFIIIPTKHEFNPYITKPYFNFIFEMVKLLKTAQTENTISSPDDLNLLNQNNFIEDSFIITQIFDCFKNIFELTKNNRENHITLNLEDKYTYRDMIHFCINILLELVTYPGMNN